MAISIYPSEVEEKLDPKARKDFTVPLQPVLEDGEEIDPLAWEIVISPEAAALGFTVLGLGDGKTDPVLTESNRAIDLWFGIDPAFQNDAAFEGEGKKLAFEVFWSTTSEPPRDDNRTFVQHVVNL